MESGAGLRPVFNLSIIKLKLSSQTSQSQTTQAVTVNQSKLQVITRRSHDAQENVCEQVVIGFAFTSHDLDACKNGASFSSKSRGALN